MNFIVVCHTTVKNAKKVNIKTFLVFITHPISICILRAQNHTRNRSYFFSHAEKISAFAITSLHDFVQLAVDSPPNRQTQKQEENLQPYYKVIEIMLRRFRICFNRFEYRGGNRREKNTKKSCCKERTI